MIKIAILGVIATIIAMQFRDNEEYGIFIALAMCLVIVSYVISKMDIVITAIKEFEKYLLIESKYINLLIKMIGITYVVELASSMCRDAGYGSIANQLEIGGKVTILAISMPITLSLLEIIEKIFV